MIRDQVGHLPIVTAEAASVVRLASQVVAMIAERTDKEPPRVRSDLAGLLEQAVCDQNTGAVDAALDAFRRHRVSLGAVIEHYIPHVALSLGQAWADDRLPFSEVAYGTARLQSLLRNISDKWVDDAAIPQNRGLILFVVPRGEQHTLGAILTIGRLRRRGIAVNLRFAPVKDDLARLFRTHRFDGVFLSVSTPDCVRECGALIKRINTLTHDQTPTMVGGALCDLARDMLTGLPATLLTNDLDLALESCGLMAAAKESRRSA